MHTFKYCQRRNHVYIGRFYLPVRRMLIVLTVISVVCLFIHLIQTGIFLVEHFLPNEQINDLSRLDTKLWRRNTQWSTKIPRRIHQIWISSKENQSIYERFEKAAHGCLHKHINYTYTLWTHDKILRWLKMEYPWFVSIYEGYSYDMQRIDAMKYFLLFHFGGIYIDLDVVCKAGDLITAMIPINHLDKEPDVILHMGTEGISANTDIMAAKRFHPLFKLALQRLQSANRWFYLYHLTIILSAGPTFFFGIYQQYLLKENIYFIPNDQLYGKLVGGVGGGTWMGRDTVILLFLMENKLLSTCVFCLVILLSTGLLRWCKKKLI